MKLLVSTILALAFTSSPLLIKADNGFHQLPRVGWHQSVADAKAPSAPPALPRPSPFVKPTLPPMNKPFGMPGVIGIQNGVWTGTDYLGYLSSHIGIDIEVLKGENTPQVPDSASLTARASEILTKDNLTPTAEAGEGPALPFLHVLLIVYPVEKDRFVVFGTCRLFEQIQVMRKNFSPAGFWQGITWENQDINLTTADKLEAQVKSTVDKLVGAFVARYRIYNPTNEGPATGNEPAIVNGMLQR